MKITTNQLNHYLTHQLPQDQLTQALINLGLEVESVDEPTKQLEPFVVGKIVSISRHVDADRLQVCMVDSGEGALVQVVCGAANARQHLVSAFAKVGTVIPSTGTPLKKGMIRGVESNGMLCSYEELMLPNQSGEPNQGQQSGIIELDPLAVPGSSILHALNIEQDTLIDLSTAYNRGDYLSVYGIARDLAAGGHGTLRCLDDDHVTNPQHQAFHTPFVVKHDASIQPEIVPSYHLRHIKALTNPSSPPWLAQYLTSLGQDPISFLVDITNFMAHNLGQPMHAFDAHKIHGDIVVGLSRGGESFKALNGQTYTLPPDAIVIGDDQGVIALAGIIGGDRCAVDEGTTEILLESAVFDPVHIAQAGQHLNITSEARMRFERGVDAAMTLSILDLAVKKIVEHQPDAALSQLLGWEHIKPPLHLNFSLGYLEKRGGLSMEEGAVKKLLTNLGFHLVAEDQGTFTLAVPSFRHDITKPWDVVEEVLRLVGYDKVPATPLPLKPCVDPGIGYQLDQLLCHKICALGYNEALTWSFVSDTQITQSTTTPKDLIHLTNPLSQEWSTMRPMILPSLLSIADKNRREGRPTGKMFELAPAYGKNHPLYQQYQLAALSFGHRQRASWHESERFIDFFDIKADLQALLQETGLHPSSYQVKPLEDHPLFHPGQAMVVSQGSRILAYGGMIHPKWIDDTWAVGGFEVVVPFLPTQSKKKTVTLSAYPPVERDFSLVVGLDIKVGDLLQAIQKTLPDLIQNIEVFDVYQGSALDADTRSIGFRVLLQAKDRTMTEEEITSWREDMMVGLGKSFGAKLRRG